MPKSALCAAYVHVLASFILFGQRLGTTLPAQQRLMADAMNDRLTFAKLTARQKAMLTS